MDKSFFRQVMGRFTTGVTVVTTHSRERLAGVTVNSFCSVSLDPPLVLVCIDCNSTTLQFFRESGSFVVNVLSDRQEHLSRGFATSSQERYEHFCYANYHVAATGSPIIDGVLAFIDVRIISEYPGGDHVIFVGQVEALGAGDQAAFTEDTIQQYSYLAEHHIHAVMDDRAAPLAYYCGQYRHLSQDYQKASLAVHSEEQLVHYHE